MTQYLTAALICLALTSSAQKTYQDSIAIYRQHYKEDFIKEARSPLKGNDTAFLRFFSANKAYRVWASVLESAGKEQFDMETHSGKKQLYRHFGVATFVLGGKTYKLSIYQNVRLLETAEHKTHLFLPFNDLTNYETTYGGGRYIDLSTDNLRNGRLCIDFNKAYNPYCAFKDGYSCPIPPVENRLKVRIEAGEKSYGKKSGHE